MSLLIKSVRILISDKNSEESFDVFINGGKISAIGNFPNKKADEIIDGQGAYLAPGFIDVDTTSDHHLTLFDDPNQEDFLGQGITTTIGGQCGASLAPLITGNLESIRKWANLNTINVGWHSLDELLFHLDKRPLGVNFGTFVGHSTIRRALIRGKLRDLTLPELETFAHLLDTSLKEGGFGLSTGLSYVHSRGTPYGELLALAKIVKKNDAIYSTHLRKSDEDIVKSVDETIRIQEETGVKTFINHFVPIKGMESAYKESLARINDLSAEHNLHFGIYSIPATSVVLYSFLPDWAKGNFEKMYEVVKDPGNEERLLTDFKNIIGKDFVVTQAMGNDSLVGKNLQDIMRIYSLSTSKKALLKLMQTTRLRAVIQHKNLNSKLITEAIKSPRSLITSHAPSIGKQKGYLKSERSTSTFTEYLKLVQNEKIMNLEDAVRKITLIPAKIFNLKERGEIKEGNIADLTLFKNNEIRCVIVNGETAFKDGATTGKMSGKILKHGHI